MNMHVTEMFELHFELILVRTMRDLSYLLGINLHLIFSSSATKEPSLILIKQLILTELLLEKSYIFIIP